jgi:butyryl-CoA dehydrogenase
VNDGFKVAMWAPKGRVSLPQALGIGKRPEERSPRSRGRPSGSRLPNTAIQFMLADMSTELDAARMLTHKAAALKSFQVSIAQEAAQAKLAASIAAHKDADTAMQILASAGYRRGSKVERLFRDARATEIYQGTSETQRMVIADHILGIPRHSHASARQRARTKTAAATTVVTGQSTASTAVAIDAAVGRDQRHPERRTGCR